MHLTLNPIVIKETGQNLIKKILYLIISQSNGIIFCFHLTRTLKNPIKLSLKSLSIYLILMHLKKLSKNKLKLKGKPSITPGLQKSISIKNQFLSKFIKLKDPCRKRKATYVINTQVS